MNVDYNHIATTFARSRKNMKWQEIDYFIDFFQSKNISPQKILDIGCGSGRLLESLQKLQISPQNYLGIDLSSGLLQEAKKNFPDFQFLEKNMSHIQDIPDTFSALFFIASFHHIVTVEERKNILSQAYKKLETRGYVFFTNWYLLGGKNYEKYGSDLIDGSDNDFSIKIGSIQRVYHGFSVGELQQLLQDTGFHLIENRVFVGERNIVTIAQKK